MNHPNICTIYEIGQANGQTHIAMEYVDGDPLSQLIPSGGLAFETALQYGKQIADALSHVHQHGLLHRDVKSSNVMVTNDGRVKLLDFGLAKHFASHASDDTVTSDTLTEPGATVGTLAYMAPEILRGETPDERSDLWALGVVLHEMLTGSRPFQATSGHALSSAILRDPPTPLPERTPPGLRTIVGKCLAKEPNQRYHSAAEVAAALEAASSSAVATPVTSKRSMHVWWAIAVAALAVVAIWVGPWSTRSTRHPRSFKSIAVLPFENQSGEGDQEFFADGMTEQLILPIFRKSVLSG